MPLGNFLSGMETLLPGPVRHPRGTLETSLVEWKHVTLVADESIPDTLETSLVEWKQ